MKDFLEQRKTVCLGTSSALCRSVVVGLLMSKVKRIHERPCLFNCDSCKRNILSYILLEKEPRDKSSSTNKKKLKLR